MGSILINGLNEAQSNITVYAAGTRVEFQCHYKYRLSESVARFCGSDGRWNGTVPQCCESPDYINEATWRWNVVCFLVENVARSATVSSDQTRKEEQKRIALLTNGLINTCGNWLTNASSLQFEFSRAYRIDGIRFVSRKENSSKT